jgi:hypothetical protein
LGWSHAAANQNLHYRKQGKNQEDYITFSFRQWCRKQKAILDFEFLTGKKAVASLLLTDKEFEQGDYKEKLEDFVKSILG